MTVVWCREKKEGVVGERERGSEPGILKTNMSPAVKTHLRIEQAVWKPGKQLELLQHFLALYYTTLLSIILLRFQQHSLFFTLEEENV